MNSVSSIVTLKSTRNSICHLQPAKRHYAKLLYHNNKNHQTSWKNDLESSRKKRTTVLVDAIVKRKTSLQTRESDHGGNKQISKESLGRDKFSLIRGLQQIAWIITSAREHAINHFGAGFVICYHGERALDVLRAIVSAGPLSSFQFPSINISSSRVRVRDSSRHCPPKIVSYQLPASSRPRNSSYPRENSLNRRPWKISCHIPRHRVTRSRLDF